MKRATPFILMVVCTVAVPTAAADIPRAVPDQCWNRLILDQWDRDYCSRLAKTAALETLATCAALRQHERQTFDRFNRATKAVRFIDTDEAVIRLVAPVAAARKPLRDAALQAFQLWHTALTELNRRTLGGECE